MRHWILSYSFDHDKIEFSAAYKIGCIFNEVTMLYGMKDTYIQMKTLSQISGQPKSAKQLMMMVKENLL